MKQERILLKNNERIMNQTTHKIMYLPLIKITNEPVTVDNISFYNTHLYNYVQGHPNHLYQWLKHPEYNISSDFNKYRKIVGLMLPKQVKLLREHYGLRVRDLAAILGMSPATISAIENNEHIQSVVQDYALRTLLNPQIMAKAIQHRVKDIAMKHYKYVNAKVLLNKSKKIETL